MAMPLAFGTTRDWLGRMPPAFMADSGATLDIDFLGATRLPSYVTFTRSSSGTYFGPDGLMKVVPCNLCLQSQDASTSWTLNAIRAFGSGSSKDVAVAPDGTTTADFIADSTTASSHNIAQNITIDNGTVYCLSAYVKIGTRGYAMLGLGGNFGGSAVVINLTTGSVSVGTGSPTGYGATNAGNGWWRVYAYATSNGTTGTFQLYISADGVYANRAYAGDNSSGIYVWGMQVERAVTTPSPYIPTTTAAASLPRFDYDPTTRAPLGLLIEGARTNSLLNSILAGGTTPTSWTLAGTGTPAVAASIYGNGDGGIAISFTASTSQQYLTQNVAGVASTTYCISARVEATSGLAIAELMIPVTGTATVTIAKYYVNGVEGNSATVPTAGSRIAITYTLSGTGNAAIRIGAGVSSNSTGTVTISRPQHETGAFPSSFVPTTTGTVARSADVCTITGTEATSRIGSQVGTMFCEFDLAGGAGSLGGGRAIMCIDDGTSTNYLQLYQSGGAPTALISGGAYTAIMGSAVAVATTTRVGLAYAVDDALGARDGTAGTADDGSTAVSNAVNKFGIGCRYGGTSDPLYGHIRRIAYWASRLTDAQLALLTDQTKISGRALSSGLYRLSPALMPPAFWAGAPL